MSLALIPNCCSFSTGSNVDSSSICISFSVPSSLHRYRAHVHTVYEQNNSAPLGFSEIGRWNTKEGETVRPMKWRTTFENRLQTNRNTQKRFYSFRSSLPFLECCRTPGVFPHPHLHYTHTPQRLSNDFSVLWNPKVDPLMPYPTNSVHHPSTAFSPNEEGIIRIIDSSNDTGIGGCCAFRPSREKTISAIGAINNGSSVSFGVEISLATATSSTPLFPTLLLLTHSQTRHTAHSLRHYMKRPLHLHPSATPPAVSATTAAAAATWRTPPTDDDTHIAR